MTVGKLFWSVMTFILWARHAGLSANLSTDEVISYHPPHVERKDILHPKSYTHGGLAGAEYA